MDRGIYNLNLDDLVPNAFIALNNRSNERITEISLDIIKKYGDEVSKKLKQDDKQVVFNLSKDAIILFSEKYSNFFALKDNETHLSKSTYVILNDGIEVKDLVINFRGNLPLGLLLAYTNKQVIQRGLLNYFESPKENSIIKQKKLEYK